MEQTTIIVGNREFTAVRMNAFAANRIFLRLQKIAVPVLGAVVGSGGGKSILDVDVKVAAAAFADHLDESVMETIILPMFAESKLYCVEKSKMIAKPTDIDQCFTSDQLFDLYELAFELLRYEFGPFFSQLVGRFGGLTGAAKTG